MSSRWVRQVRSSFAPRPAAALADSAGAGWTARLERGKARPSRSTLDAQQSQHSNSNSSLNPGLCTPSSSSSSLSLIHTHPHPHPPHSAVHSTPPHRPPIAPRPDRHRAGPSASAALVPAASLTLIPRLPLANLYQLTQSLTQPHPPTLLPAPLASPQLTSSPQPCHQCVRLNSTTPDNAAAGDSDAPAPVRMQHLCKGASIGHSTRSILDSTTPGALGDFTCATLQGPRPMPRLWPRIAR